jgi:DNA-binding response OmpR family regulator
VKKILIIEDDKNMCKDLSDILRDEGYWVDSVNNGIEGIKAIAQGEYSLVLLDLKLPGLTGFEILKSAKKNKPELKIIVLTGRPLVKESEEGIASINEDEEVILRKADFVVNKPFDIEDILNKIKEFL